MGSDRVRHPDRPNGEPIFGKAHPQPHREHKRMTWTRFLRLREWAQAVADDIGGRVYLVGSVLQKTIPRDVDVSVVLPKDEFERRFGPLPASDATEQEYGEYLLGPQSVTGQHAIDIEIALRWVHRIDLKLHPDHWWPEKDKLLLAEPKGD